MKNYFLLAFIGLFFLNAMLFAQEKSAQEFQKELNEQYADPEKSPLLKKNLKSFKGLPFYPINENYSVIANLEKITNGKEFTFETTTDRKAKYKVYALARFQLDGKNYQLTIYKSLAPKKAEYKDYLFLPFTDATNGNETYGGGRYLNLLVTEKDEIIIDFNKAYNPYCAYNDAYSCPIPPPENSLDIKIEAGVKYNSPFSH